jgi:hypothetical protein
MTVGSATTAAQECLVYGLVQECAKMARMAPPPIAAADMSASRLAHALAAGELTAVEAHIARIEEVDPRLNAVVVPLFDDARDRARLWPSSVRPMP